MSIFTALCGGLVGVLSSAYFLLGHFNNRIKLTTRAGLYMWIVLFGSIGSILVGSVDLLKLAITTPLSGSEATPTARPPTARPTARAVSNPTPSCLKWDQITSSMEGKTLPCVYGIVVDYVENPTLNATYFYFGRRDQFFLVASDVYFLGFKDGDCAKATGTVQLNTYRTPYLKVDDVYFCE
ncbi:MAG: hypothetical protein HY864_00730 [Chloroflexi bacterium]|nr:hypothetical protein [Chloroflexota bacterium]